MCSNFKSVKQSKGPESAAEVANATVVHYLEENEGKLQHRDLYDYEKNLRLNYTHELQGVLMYVSVRNI